MSKPDAPVERPRSSLRGLTIINTAAIVVLLATVLGIFLQGRGVVSDNRDLLCSLSDLVSRSPIKPQPGQTSEEFRNALKPYKRFVHDLQGFGTGKCSEGITKRLQEKLHHAERLLDDLSASTRAPPSATATSTGVPTTTATDLAPAPTSAPSGSAAPTPTTTATTSSSSGGNGGESPSEPPPPQTITETFCHTDVAGARVCVTLP